MDIQGIQMNISSNVDTAAIVVISVVCVVGVYRVFIPSLARVGFKCANLVISEWYAAAAAGGAAAAASI